MYAFIWNGKYGFLISSRLLSFCSIVVVFFRWILLLICFFVRVDFFFKLSYSCLYPSITAFLFPNSFSLISLSIHLAVNLPYSTTSHQLILPTNPKSSHLTIYQPKKRHHLQQTTTKNSKTLRGRETGGADTLSSDISGLQHPVLTGGGGGRRQVSLAYLRLCRFGITLLCMFMGDGCRCIACGCLWFAWKAEGVRLSKLVLHNVGLFAFLWPINFICKYLLKTASSLGDISHRSTRTNIH